MFSIGYGTIVLYLISLAFFLLGAFYPNHTLLYMALGAFFFVISSGIIGLMVKKRIGT